MRFTGCLTHEGTLRELDRKIYRSVRGGLALSVCFIDVEVASQAPGNRARA